MHPEGCRGHVMRVRIQCLSTEAAREYADWVQHKTRTDFSQDLFLWVILVQRSLGGDLVVSKPDFVVQPIEAHAMIVEGLTLGMIPGSTERLREQTLY